MEKDPPPVDPLKAAGGVARGGGAGLGLAICRGVLHLMGGEISVHSEYGRGSRFEATFVLGRGGGNDGGRKSPAAKEEAPTFTISTPSLRILVVEDDDLNWWVVCSMLERHGHRVRRARDGAEAVETVADVLQGRSGEPFELILMDVSLPLMDGFTATALIRKLETSAAAARRVPVLALTAFATKADKEKCLQAGMEQVEDWQPVT